MQWTPSWRTCPTRATTKVAAGHDSDSGHGHGHGVSGDADRCWLGIALGLIVSFMVAEVIVGLIAGSLALISDAGHMLTDAASIVLALIAIRLAARPARGQYTYGLKRAEILSAQANGITLLLLAVFFTYEGVRRLIDPPPVGVPVRIVSPAANGRTWSVSGAGRSFPPRGARAGSGRVDRSLDAGRR